MIPVRARERILIFRSFVRSSSKRSGWNRQERLWKRLVYPTNFFIRFARNHSIDVMIVNNPFCFQRVESRINPSPCVARGFRFVTGGPPDWRLSGRSICFCVFQLPSSILWSLRNASADAFVSPCTSSIHLLSVVASVVYIIIRENEFILCFKHATRYLISSLSSPALFDRIW